MKLTKLKIKIPKFLLSSKYLYGILILILVGGLGFLGLFLYQNFYQTITQSKQIVLLKKEVAPNTIDNEKVDIVMSALKNKADMVRNINTDLISNPFFTQQVLIANPAEIKNPQATTTQE